MAENTLRIVQPYHGDRGKLTVTVEASNLPAGAYAALEPLMEQAEQWAEEWLPVTRGDHGNTIPWFELPVKNLPLSTRARNALAKATYKTMDQILNDIYVMDRGYVFDKLERVPNFGSASIHEFRRFVLENDEREPWLVEEE